MFCVLLNSSLHAQTYIPAKSTWVFGNGAMLKFGSNGSPTPSVINYSSNAMVQYEGVASISDRSSGDLLFYSNGVDVWDKTNKLIENGNSVVSTSSNSSTQATLIVPMPGNSTKYYLFTNSDIVGSSGSGFRSVTNPTTVSYSIIDMTRSFKGEIDASNKNLPLKDAGGTNPLQGITEKMTAVKHSNGEDYWLIFHLAYNSSSTTTAATNRFIVYKISKKGICYDHTDDIGTEVNYITGTNYNGACLGYLKASPDGTKLAMAIRDATYAGGMWYGLVELFDLNASTGSITNPQTVASSASSTTNNGLYYNPGIQKPYGIAFSADNSILYVATNGYQGSNLQPDGTYKGGDEIRTYQIVISTNKTTINLLSIQIAEQTPASNVNGYPRYPLNYNGNYSGLATFLSYTDDDPNTTAVNESGAYSDYIGALQIGPDGNIYAAWMTSNIGTSKYLGRIVPGNPYVHKAITFSSAVVRAGLPNMIENDLSPVTCPSLVSQDFTPHYSRIQNSSGNMIDNKITTNTVWTGKHTVNGIIIVDNAELDLTGVDIMFQPNSGFLFQGTASVKAINSTFRVCESESWKGFEFIGNSKGVIEECQFINAEKGVYVHGDAQVKISNNLFRNNHYGVYLGKTGETYTDYLETVSGNTFEVTKNDIFYSSGNNDCTISSSDFYGIAIYYRNLKEKISQNNFRFTNSSIGVSSNSLALRFFGIYMSYAGGYISENTFTNMYRGIDAYNSNGAIAIENNKFDLGNNQFNNTASTLVDIHQIHISNENNTMLPQVIVFGNELNNYMPARTNTSVCGIYLYKMSNAILNQNNLKGFDFSIFSSYCDNIEIKRNKVEDGLIQGIHSSFSGTNIFIIENYIRMKSDMTKVRGATSGTTTGLVFAPTNINSSSSKIIGNAIYDCNDAVWTTGTNQFSTQFPTFENNYLFNYTINGIYIRYFSNTQGLGSGTTGTTLSFTQSGHNSFISNYKHLSGVYDLCYDLYGNMMAIPTNDVFKSNGDYYEGNPNTLNSIVNFEDAFHSITTLHKESNNSNGLTQDFIESHFPISYVDGKYELAKNYLEYINKIEKDERRNSVNSILNILYYGSEKEVVESYYNSIITSNLLEGNSLKWFNFAYYSLKGDIAKIEYILENLTPENINEERLLTIEKIKLKLAKTSAKPDEKDLAKLKEIDKEKGLYAAVAREMLNTFLGGHDYIFQTPEEIQHSKINAKDEMFANKGGENLTIWPNPASDKVFIKYYLQNVNNANLSVHDITGKVIYSAHVTANSTYYNIDISTFKQGFYMVTLENEQGIFESKKLLIQK